MSSHIALIGAALASAYMAVASGWHAVTKIQHNEEQVQGVNK
jgi:hypothetical protein